MATTDLGLVRDKITEVRKISENGTSATYAIMTEMNNTGTGAGTFTVKNGGNIAISEVFNSISDLVNGIKQCGANHIGEVVAIFYQSSSYAWQEVQPNYLFATADTNDIAQLNGLSLYSATGNLLSSGNFVFAYYAVAEVEDSNPKLDGVTLGTYNTLSDLADAVYAAYNSLRTNDKFVGRVGNGSAPEFESTVYTFNFKYRVDASLSYFEYTSAEKSGIAKNDNGTWTFEDKTSGVIDLGSYNNMDEALDSIYNEIDSISDVFDKGEKYIAKANTSDVTVVGYDDVSGIMIGYASDFYNENSYFFAARRELVNNVATWKMTKYGYRYGIENVADEIATLKNKHYYKHFVQIIFSNAYNGSTTYSGLAYLEFISTNSSPISSASSFDDYGVLDAVATGYAFDGTSTHNIIEFHVSGSAQSYYPYLQIVNAAGSQPSVQSISISADAQHPSVSATVSDTVTLVELL